MKRLIAADKGEEDDDEDLSTLPFKCDVHYAIKTWLEHRIHHTYPRAGGYDDQDADLMDDWFMLNVYHVRVSKNIISQFAMPTDAPDVSTLIRN
jgi:hypothetical protein